LALLRLPLRIALFVLIELPAVVVAYRHRWL
jgi:hypothetical protein